MDRRSASLNEPDYQSTGSQANKMNIATAATMATAMNSSAVRPAVPVWSLIGSKLATDARMMPSIDAYAYQKLMAS